MKQQEHQQRKMSTEYRVLPEQAVPESSNRT